MAQQFCLKWNNHMNNMMDVFKNLLSTESMVDVTLACDGLSLKAHKIVLSACSPFFQSLFLENPCKHPIVILKDMKYSELKAIIEFMYHGEVNVAQDQLSALMKTAETLRVKGLAEMPNEKSSSNASQEEPGHRSVPRTETPPPSSKRRRGRVRKRSLSDSNRSDDSNETKIKQPPSPDIEELSGDVTMDTSGQFSNLQSQVPMQSLPSHSTNSYQKTSSVVSQDPQIEEPASADESEFGVEPAKLLEQTLTTDDLSNARRSGRSSVSGMEMQRRPRSSTDHSSNLVPTSMPSEALGSNQQPESPPDIKPELLELDPPMSPVAGPSHSTDNSMMMYMDQSSVSSHPGTSYQDNTALVPQDSQPQGTVTADCSSKKKNRKKRKSAVKILKKERKTETKTPYVLLERINLGGNIPLAKHVSEENCFNKIMEGNELVEFVSNSIDPDVKSVSGRSNSGIGHLPMQISRKSTSKMLKKKRKTDTKTPYVLLERVDLGENIPLPKHVSEGKCSDEIMEESELDECVSSPIDPEVEKVSERSDSCVGHLPIQTSRRLCVYCFYTGTKRRTQWQCMACDLALCCQMDGETCFQLYHSSNLKSSIERSVAIMEKERLLNISESDSSWEDCESEMTDSDNEHLSDGRNSNGGHYPMKGVFERRCVNCKDKRKVKYTVWACEVCDVPLCVQKKGATCFRAFHSAMLKSVEDSSVSIKRDSALADDSDDDSDF